MGSHTFLATHPIPKNATLMGPVVVLFMLFIKGRGDGVPPVGGQADFLSESRQAATTFFTAELMWSMASSPSSNTR